jgi:putative membrane protein
MEPVNSRNFKNDLRVQEKANIEIRDSLAIERTKFANERTFLAYMRTAMGLVLAGFSLIQFFHDQIYSWLGVLLIPVGIILSIIGLKKFVAKRKQIGTHSANYKLTSHLHAMAAADAKARSEQKLQ